jgi:hypothetical protein
VTTSPSCVYKGMWREKRGSQGGVLGETCGSALWGIGRGERERVVVGDKATRRAKCQ